MNFKVENKLFIVGGAGSGFGRSIASVLASEGADVLAISRTEEKLISLVSDFPNKIEYLCGDIMKQDVQDKILTLTADKQISGVVFNASGPPAGGFADINMQMWDEAWETVVRWKIAFAESLLPILK